MSLADQIERTKAELADLERRVRRDRKRARHLDGDPEGKYSKKRPRLLDPESLDEFVFMKDGVLKPPPDPGRKPYVWSRGKVGKVVRPPGASGSVTVVVLFDGTYHAWRKGQAETTPCVGRMLKAQKNGRPRIVWYGWVADLERALPRIRAGRDAKPCTWCFKREEVPDFRFGGKPGRKPRGGQKAISDADWDQVGARFKHDGQFDSQMRHRRRAMLTRRASAKVSNPEVMAVHGDISDDFLDSIPR